MRRTQHKRWPGLPQCMQAGHLHGAGAAGDGLGARRHESARVGTSLRAFDEPVSLEALSSGVPSIVHILRPSLLFSRLQQLKVPILRLMLPRSARSLAFSLSRSLARGTSAARTSPTARGTGPATCPHSPCGSSFPRWMRWAWPSSRASSLKAIEGHITRHMAYGMSAVSCGVLRCLAVSWCIPEVLSGQSMERLMASLPSTADEARRPLCELEVS